MGLTLSDFEKFFKAVNGNHGPFRWQENLLSVLLQNGRWPDRIAAPTGSGKTSAIDVHVFATALSAQDGWPRLPRRLALVVNRRVLVDDQYERARYLSARLQEALAATEDSVLGEVALALSSLDKLGDRVNREATTPYPLVTGRLRGGSVPSRSWRDNPNACAVLCATPDMWGSRLLFGGYGTADRAASREAGLLAFDSVVLVDEAHLSRQLLVTADRVAELAIVAEEPLSGVPALQVVAVSATPGKRGQVKSSVAVEDDDLAANPELNKRLTTPKPVKLVPVPEWPNARQLPKIASAAARAVSDMRSELASAHQETASRSAATIGCYVNSVPMAVTVAKALRSEGLRVVLVCGQVRPADLERLREEYPGLLTVEGSDQVDVLVTTQSLEVGADLDLAGIVTELASASALAQRAGRVNRIGKRDYEIAAEDGKHAVTAVTVLVPPDELPDLKNNHSGPYSVKELNEALGWVRGLEADRLGIAPWAVHQSAVPEQDADRILYQRPELADAWQWARTSDELAAEPELDLWLSDSFDGETSVGIVVRDVIPVDPTEAEDFVRGLPPDRREVFPVPYRTAQAVLRDLLQAEELDPSPVPIRVRGEDISALKRRDSDRVDIRPGDLVVIDSSEKIATPIEGMFSPPVVVAPAAPDSEAEDELEQSSRVQAEDLLHYLPPLDPPYRELDARYRGRLVLRLEWAEGKDRIAGFPRDLARRIVTEFADSPENAEGLAEGDRHSALAALLNEIADDAIPANLGRLVRAVTDLVSGPVKDSDIIVQPDEAPCRILVLDRRRAIAEEDRQIFAQREKEVFLEEHQGAVAERASWLAKNLNLPDGLRTALRLAGLHHDDGKADHRFQTYRLGKRGDGNLLAKSRRETIREARGDQRQAGLPSHWRHEQRSVVDAWDPIHAQDVDPALALRLIGTSHGHGRSGFPHTARELAGPTDPAHWLKRASDLFDFGGWDELIELTHLRYGVWGCAYLEAVLRAADCQVSGEGK